MKTKQFDKKMVLNKKTVAHLNNGEMNAVAGGASVLSCGAFTCKTNCGSICTILYCC